MSIKLYSDESLESFFLRLSNRLLYPSFLQFLEEELHTFETSIESRAGYFPNALSCINICHAKDSSKKRVISFLELEKELELENLSILKLALLNSDSKFLGKLTAVKRDGVHYPQILLRHDIIPICPECLKEDEYIRQCWHFHSYTVCHKHQIELIYQCPDCGSGINYIYEELISDCSCGFSFALAPRKKGSIEACTLSTWISGHGDISNSLPRDMPISERYGFLAWYVNRYGNVENPDLENLHSYCQHWPANFFAELDKKLEDYEYLRTKHWKNSSISDVFGGLVLDSRYLPSKKIDNNIALRTVLSYLMNKLKHEISPKDKKLSLVLLSTVEAASLLSCSVKEIKRLYDFGIIQSYVKTKIDTSLTFHQPCFRLEEVLSVRLTRMSSECSELDYFLPSW